MVKLILPTGQCFKICKAGLQLFVSNKWRLLGDIYLTNNKVFFHRALVGAPKNMAVDHIDRDYFNMHVSNLRICTKRENNLNRGKFKNSKNKYKGVRFSNDRLKRAKPWLARITLDGTRHVKRFKTELEAAKWYNTMATRLHGKFAAINNIEEDL